MRKPFLTVHEPDKDYYLNRKENIEIYSYYQHFGKCQYCGEEDCDETCSEALEDREEDEDNNIVEDMNLQKLLDMLPEGVKPSDVKMNVSIDASDMAVEGASMYFYYVKPLPPLTEQYEKLKAEYDKEYAAYTIRKDAYNAWIKEEEIKRLEEQLKNLRK